MQNVVRFIGTVLGTILLIAGIIELQSSDRSGWWYIAAGLLAFVVAAAPGRRIRDALKRP